MDKFLSLPLYQRFAAVVTFMLLFGAGYYFLVIADASDKIVAEQGKTKRIQMEYNSLSAYKDREKRDRLQREFEEEERKIAENKKMLPTEEEIPGFIISIKADADLAGLEILRFETKSTEEEDYYKRIPIEMEVRGDFHQLVKFFKTLAAPKKRIVNISDLDIERLPLNLKDIKKEMGQSTAQQWEEMSIESKKNDKGNVSLQEARLRNLRDWEEANGLSLFKATFIANAFSYTGNPLSEEVKAKRQKDRGRRSRR